MDEGFEFEDFNVPEEFQDDNMYEETTTLGGEDYLDTSTEFQDRLNLQIDAPERLDEQLTKTKVDAFYDSIARKYGLKPNFINYEKFKYENGKLYFGGHEMTYKNDSTKFLALTSIQGKYGIDFIKNDLNLVDYTSSSKGLDLKSREEINKISQPLNNIQVEGIPMQELPRVSEEVEQAVGKINEVLGKKEVLVQTEGLNFRELVGLDKALTKIRGELANNLSKLTSVENEIHDERLNLAKAERLGNEEQQRDIRAKLQDLEAERETRLEFASQNSEALRSQINRIKETIHRITEDDTTLREKINTLFREQGITVISILSALTLLVSTIISSIVAGFRGSTTVPTPKPSPGPSPNKNVKQWMKEKLKHLSDLFKKLGAKALDALPGIIGAAVSWLFNLLSGSVAWLAEHVWALITGVGLLVFMYLQKELST